MVVSQIMHTIVKLIVKAMEHEEDEKDQARYLHGTYSCCIHIQHHGAV